MFGGLGRGGLVRTVGRTAVVAGTASAVAGGVHRRQRRRWAEDQQVDQAQQQAAYDQGQADAAVAMQAPTPAQSTAPTSDDKVDRLKRMADLRDQGILTDDEFAAEKAKILAE